MDGQQNPKPRTSLFLTLITAGVFMIGAVLIPLLVRGQANALDSSELIRPPTILNQTAPQLGLTDLKGSPVNLGNTRGEVILVNNWATWCPPCKTEMPDLQAYYQAHIKQGFTIIAIESGEPADTVTNFIRKLELTFPVWLDPKELALEAFQNWDLPSSYVVDRQGRLRMSWTGPVNRATLERYVTPLLDIKNK